MNQHADYDARVREIFVDAASHLVSIPAQHKKRLAILRWLVEDFQPGRRYMESEVNDIISRHHPDFAALRRHLVDEELIRDGAEFTGEREVCPTLATTHLHGLMAEGQGFEPWIGLHL